MYLPNRILILLFVVLTSKALSSSIYDKGSNQFICMREEEKHFTKAIQEGKSAERFFKDRYQSPCQYRYLYRYRYKTNSQHHKYHGHKRHNKHHSFKSAYHTH